MTATANDLKDRSKDTLIRFIGVLQYRLELMREVELRKEKERIK